ncbi:MAG: lipoyl synthase [Gammaproteobacteria bacterium]|nr:lipoyl synthase [Gammaproteobacteria bacterium]
MPNTTTIKAKSGEKYLTPHGFSAIRDGLKSKRSARLVTSTELPPTDRKPRWIRARLPSGRKYEAVSAAVHDHQLHTVCEESHCPNLGECWSAGTATLMLLGSVCTRACRFCSVDTGNPNGWIDAAEPRKSARAVQLMQLKYVVLTSVDRDDLNDGGAAHYAACVHAIHDVNPTTVIEALTPDFGGDLVAVDTVTSSPISVFAQNIETVERLTHPVRDPRAGYEQTLRVLQRAKASGSVQTKSSLMLGLGETDDEIEQTMLDLLRHGVDFLTLGQYLRPTRNHLPVERWVHPDEFDSYRELGCELGFKDVAAGPLVRSSYRADRLISHFE